jgi:hypothetical protein
MSESFVMDVQRENKRENKREKMVPPPRVELGTC